MDVKKETLKKYGAVSKETAREMAKGGAFKSGTDICVGITGIAGPNGATEEKPVGLVYISCFYNNHTYVNKYVFKGNREKIRQQAVTKALDTIRRCVLNETI